MKKKKLLMPSKQLKDLHPEFTLLASKFLYALKSAGLDILVTCTYRSSKEQDVLYAQGRATPGKIVTRAKAGQSDHNFMLNGTPASKAFDIVPLRQGAPVWDSSAAEWQKISDVWKCFCSPRLGWAGRENSPFSDKPHFYLKDL